MTKHTPGPWKVYIDSGGKHFIISDTTPRHADHIATIHPAYKNRSRLIAAAPELLEACQAVLAIDAIPEEEKKD